MPRLNICFLIAFLLAVFSLPVSPVRAGAVLQETNGNIGEADYWALVDETLQAVNSLEEGQPADSLVSVLSPYIERWEAITAITLEDGSIIPASGKYIASVLRSNDLSRSRAALETLNNARDQHKIRRVAGDLDSLAPILARSEFQWQEQEPNPIQKFIHDMLQRFWDWLANVLPKDGFTFGIPSVRLLFDVMAGILFMLVLIFILRYVYTGFITETASQNGGEDEAEILNAQTAMSRAQTFSGEGDYRTAVRYLYLSALLLLDERGLLRYDRAKTNREYLRSLAAYPELAAPLGEVIDVFDRVWYGFEALDEQTYAHYRAHVESLKEQK